MMGNDGYLCLLRFIFLVAFLHSCILDMNLLPGDGTEITNDVIFILKYWNFI